MDRRGSNLHYVRLIPAFEREVPFLLKVTESKSGCRVYIDSNEKGTPYLGLEMRSRSRSIQKGDYATRTNHANDQYKQNEMQKTQK